MRTIIIKIFILSLLLITSYQAFADCSFKLKFKFIDNNSLQDGQSVDELMQSRVAYFNIASLSADNSNHTYNCELHYNCDASGTCQNEEPCFADSTETSINQTIPLLNLSAESTLTWKDEDCGEENTGDNKLNIGIKPFYGNSNAAPECDATAAGKNKGLQVTPNQGCLVTTGNGTEQDLRLPALQTATTNIKVNFSNQTSARSDQAGDATYINIQGLDGTIQSSLAIGKSDSLYFTYTPNTASSYKYGIFNASGGKIANFIVSEDAYGDLSDSVNMITNNSIYGSTCFISASQNSFSQFSINITGQCQSPETNDATTDMGYNWILDNQTESGEYIYITKTGESPHLTPSIHNNYEGAFVNKADSDDKNHSNTYDLYLCDGDSSDPCSNEGSITVTNKVNNNGKNESSSYSASALNCSVSREENHTNYSILKISDCG